MNKPVMDYDGIADIYAKSFEDMQKAFSDPFYLNEIKRDEIKFIDVDKLTITAGYVEAMIKDGEILRQL
jgi:hypothetical protein